MGGEGLLGKKERKAAGLETFAGAAVPPIPAGGPRFKRAKPRAAGPDRETQGKPKGGRARKVFPAIILTSGAAMGTFRQ